MIRGFCASRRKVGSLFKPKAWQCPTCSKLYCTRCCPKVGLFFKKPACPNCLMELKGWKSRAVLLVLLSFSHLLLLSSLNYLEVGFIESSL